MYGYAPKDFIDNFSLLDELLHPEDRMALQNDKIMLSHGKQVKGRYRIIHKNGTTRYVAIKIVPVLNQAGELMNLYGIVKDITKQEQTKVALQHSEYLIRQFFENAYEAILVVDASNTLIQDYNDNALKLFKTTAAEILSATPGRFFPEFQPDGQRSASKAADMLSRLRTSKNLKEEWMMVDTAGKEILCELSLTAVNAVGNDHIFISIVDVTDKVRVKTQLLQQEILYSKLLESIQDAVTLVGSSCKILYQSPSATQISGFSLEEVQDMTIYDLIHAGDLPAMKSLFQQLLANPGVPYTRQFRCRHKSGSYLWMEGTITNMLGDTNIKAMVATYRNIEARKRAEQEIEELNGLLENRVKERTAELLYANKELEAFTYTVSHDLQAPLRSICGFTKILVNECSSGLNEEGLRFLNIIDSSSQHMSQLIKDLLDFSKLGKQELAKRRINMGDLAKVVAEEIEHQTTGVKYKLVINPLKDAVGDMGLLRQVWANLIGNAVKYSSKKECPEIEIGVRRMNYETVYYIKDNSVSFDMKLADNLFTAFKRLHTTEEFEDTGVGLATVQRIVNLHGERIWAEAQVDQGATFYFTLGC